MNYDNTNSGKVWKKEKRPGKNDPDFIIEFNFNGLDYRVPIWKRREDANPKAPPWTFKIEPKDPQQAISQQAVSKVRKNDPISTGKPLYPADETMNDDIPF